MIKANKLIAILLLAVTAACGTMAAVRTGGKTPVTIIIGSPTPTPTVEVK